MKNDKEVVFEAVKKDGYAFKFTSENLRIDIEVDSLATLYYPNYF